MRKREGKEDYGRMKKRGGKQDYEKISGILRKN